MNEMISKNLKISLFNVSVVLQSNKKLFIYFVIHFKIHFFFKLCNNFLCDIVLKTPARFMLNKMIIFVEISHISM